MAYTGEKKREYDKAYRLKNKEKLAQYNKNWRNENVSKEKQSLDNKLYREKNKERLKEYRKKLAQTPNQRYLLGQNILIKNFQLHLRSGNKKHLNLVIIVMIY